MIVLATFLTLVSAGILLVLFALPETSIIPNVLQSDSAMARAVGVAYLGLLLLLAMGAGVLVMRDLLKRPSSPLSRATAIAIVCSLGAAAIDGLMALLPQRSGATHILWVDALVMLLALTCMLRGHLNRTIGNT